MHKRDAVQLYSLEVMLVDFEEVGTLKLEDTLDQVDSQPYFSECLSVHFKIIWMQGLGIAVPAVPITKDKSMGTIICLWTQTIFWTKIPQHFFKTCH